MIENPDVDESPAAPSILDEIQRKAQDLFRGILLQRLSAFLDQVLERTFRRMMAYFMAAAFFITGAIFALIAGTEGLVQAGAPPWVAHLSLALAGALAGSLLLHAASRRESR